jgi:hypothetical protein
MTIPENDEFAWFKFDDNTFPIKLGFNFIKIEGTSVDPTPLTKRRRQHLFIKT